MGKVNISSLGAGYGAHENTLSEYDNEISEELLHDHLQKIARVYDNNESYLCYVLGMGSHPKSTYVELKKESGVEVIWYESILPGIFKILSTLIASYAGLIKISAPEKLPSIVKKLSHLSMAGIYIFNQSIEKKFVEQVIKNPFPKEFDFGIKSDSGYFFYIVDADNAESSTGIYEVVSYGKNATDFASVL